MIRPAIFFLSQSVYQPLCSAYRAYADDIVASSGFAFRMWIDSTQLCPSQTSIWEFKKQKSWVENGGLQCAYIERLWNEEEVEESRRLEAVTLIRNSIDADVAPVAWDVSGCEWGLLTGYDDARAMFSTLKIDGQTTELSYEKLGCLEIPILSVLTVTGCQGKELDRLVQDTKALAASHLRGEEYCDNVIGLAAYKALTSFIREKLTEDIWSLQSTLGTYAALKYYGWKFFSKYGVNTLAELYRTIYTAWKSAFDLTCSKEKFGDLEKMKIIRQLNLAGEAETQALDYMKK